MKNLEKNYELGPEHQAENNPDLKAVYVYQRLSNMRELIAVNNVQTLSLFAEREGNTYQVGVGTVVNDEFQTIYFSIAETEEGKPKTVADFFFADSEGTFKKYDHEVRVFKSPDSKEEIVGCHDILSRAYSPVGAL